MLNSPNEWHNEEDIDDFPEEEYSDDEYMQDYSDDGSDAYEDYDDTATDDAAYDEDEEYEDEDDTRDNDGNLKKYLMIGSGILLFFLLLVGGIFGISKFGGKNSKIDSDIAAIEKSDDSLSLDDENNIDIENNDADKEENEEEVSIEIDDEDASSETASKEKTADKETSKTAEADDASGLEVAIEEQPAGEFTGKPGDGTVTIAIGDVGRKNPFAPIGSVSKLSSVEKKQDELLKGIDFEVIEPPQLSAERADIAKLLHTKVAGILYDKVRPSAIINIDGVDQLIRTGDVLSGFEIIAITKNKVVIQSDNNVYRASVGQPLNAERVVSSVEISNLQSKFWGSEEHK